MKSVAILSLDNVDLQNDSRVLRQIRALSTRYAVDVVTYADPARKLDLPARSVRVVGSLSDSAWKRRLQTLALLSAGKVFPDWAYSTWYWNRPGHRQAYQQLEDHPVDFIHANDWWTLPVAMRAAQHSGAKVICDLHEYALDEFVDRLWWRVLYRPVVKSVLSRHLPQVDATITVNHMIAERYRIEFGVDPVVVMNAPEMKASVEFRPTEPGRVRMIHHGAAIRARRLEEMIAAVALAGARYDLTFMLFGDPRYIRDLEIYAEKYAPGRIHFRQPVEPAKIHSVLCEYDLGLFVLPSQGFNYLATLPNKFFEFVSAGLAVMVGPSPEMVSLIQEHGFGAWSASFAPADVAARLNQLSAVDIDAMKRAAICARTQLCAEHEMKKLLDLYASLEGSAA